MKHDKNCLNKFHTNSDCALGIIPDGKLGFTPTQRAFNQLYAEALNILEVAMGFGEMDKLISARNLLKSAIARTEDKIVSVI